MPKEILLGKSVDTMSKILQLAQEIDGELKHLYHLTDHLTNELADEKSKNRQFLMKLKNLIEEGLSDE